MNELKKLVKNAVDRVNEIEFVFSCRAHCDGLKTPVYVDVSGYHKFKKDRVILTRLREMAINRLISNMDPLEVSAAINDLRCPTECKSLLFSIMWFAFGCNSPDEMRGEWHKLYREYDKNYSHDYTDDAMCRRMLRKLGMSKNFIEKRKISRRRIRVAAYNVRGEPRNTTEKDQDEKTN